LIEQQDQKRKLKREKEKQQFGVPRTCRLETVPDAASLVASRRALAKGEVGYSAAVLPASQP